MFGVSITPSLSVGPPGGRYMFGGVGLAAAVSAAERVSSRPVIWATAQYLSPMPSGGTLDLEVWRNTQGRHTSQLQIIGRHNNQEVLSAVAATGVREAGSRGRWLQMPSVLPPQACPATRHWRGDEWGLHGQIDVKVAQGRYSADREGHPAPDGRMIVWVKPRVAVATDAALLALLADLAPNGVGNALGANAGGNSLDNTIRVLGVVPTEWVLVDVQICGIERGFAHAEVHLYAESGDLMAVGSQSLILRIRPQSLSGFGA
jgi:acyl-CoA thioesterase